MQTYFEKREQEQKAIVWVVGQMVGLAKGKPVHIPIEPVEPFQSLLDLFNEKVRDKADYNTWRQMILRRVAYIKRRERKGQNTPWYRPYFLHFLGKGRAGLQILDEPETYIPKPAPKRKARLSSGFYDGSNESEEEDEPMKKMRRASTVPPEE